MPYRNMSSGQYIFLLCNTSNIQTIAGPGQILRENPDSIRRTFTFLKHLYESNRSAHKPNRQISHECIQNIFIVYAAVCVELLFLVITITYLILPALLHLIYGGRHSMYIILLFRVLMKQHRMVTSYSLTGSFLGRTQDTLHRFNASGDCLAFVTIDDNVCQRSD